MIGQTLQPAGVMRRPIRELSPDSPRGTLGPMKKTGSSFLMKVLAVLVLAVAAWILLKVVIGILAGVAWIIVIVLAVVGVLWAWNTLTD